MKKTPLVSCIMPTYNRPHYLLRAIYMFYKQDYPNKELIIVDDSDRLVIPKIPKMSNITYIQLSKKHRIGTKRNIAVKHAKGDIFIFWDDDDLYSPTRISKQVKPIIKDGYDISVFSNVIYFDSCNGTYFKTTKEIHQTIWYKGYLCGTLASKKNVWKNVKFRPISLAEDKYYIEDAENNGARLKPVYNDYDFIYTKHGGNTFKFTVPRINIPSERIPNSYQRGFYNINAYT